LVLLYVSPTHNIVNFLINFTFLTATYLSKARYSPFVLKVPLNPNQSIEAFAVRTGSLETGVFLVCNSTQDMQF